MGRVSDKVRAMLFASADAQYKEFHAKLCPTVDRDRIIGVRIPVQRKTVKAVMSDPEISAEDIEEFFMELPHAYYEEDNVHAMLVCAETADIGRMFARLKAFLPFVDNWATTDIMAPVIIKKHRDEAMQYLSAFIADGGEYAVRFAVVMLMKYYIGTPFAERAHALVEGIRTDSYYVNMARSWYFAEGLIKHDAYVLRLIESRTTDKFTQNKSIQKARESFRLTEEEKLYLNGFKIK